MKKIKNFKKIVSFIVAIAVMVSISAPVMATTYGDYSDYDDSNTKTVTYSADDTSESMTWKHFNTLLGYDYDGLIKNYDTYTDIINYTSDGTEDGQLIYQWVWDGSEFSNTILAAGKGPTDLTVTATYTETTDVLELYVPLQSQIHGDSSTYTVDGVEYYSNPAIYSGYAELTYYVGDYYEDGTVLSVTAEYNTVSITPNDTAYSQEVTVTDGYITLPVDRGGTYTIVKASNTTVYDSSSTTEKITWKQFNLLLGYDMTGTELSGAAQTVGVYEFRVGGTSDGELSYSWIFDGADFTTPITSATKGPINLTVSTDYSEDTGLSLDFDLYSPETEGVSSVLSGYATLTMDVSDYFEDGETIIITGLDDAYYSEVTVEDGFVSFGVNQGGSYKVVSYSSYYYPEYSATCSTGSCDIIISADEGVISEDDRITVEQIVSGDEYDIAAASLNEIASEFILFNMSLYTSDNIIDENGFTGEVTFKIPVPDGYDNPAVYYVDANGDIEELDFTIEDGYIIFSTSHFSYYAIAEVIQNEDNSVVLNNNITSTITDAATAAILTKTTTSTEASSTGDEAHIGLMLFTLAVSGSIIIFLKKRTESEWNN